MFRKIVTELMYSPALAGSLGGYIKKLRNEKSKRQIGIIFTLLAVIVQLFATISPPESANASNPDIFIDGGITSIDDYLTHYDQNAENIRDFLASLGITRSEVSAASLATLPTPAGALQWSMRSNRSDTVAAHSFQTARGKQGVAYSYPLALSGDTPSAYLGTSSALGGWFAIIKGTGSLVTEKALPFDCNAAKSSTEPLAVGSWDGGATCSELLERSLSVRTISPTHPSALHKLHSSDRIAYTLTVTNRHSEDLSLAPAINVEDILEYARLLDNGGGEYDYDTRTINWPAATLGAGETLERSFIVQLLPTIPRTARGHYITASYDCAVSTSFGNTITLPVTCPPTKHIECLTNSLPQLSVEANLIVVCCLLALVLYLYARARQLLTELYIIRYLYLGGL